MRKFARGCWRLINVCRGTSPAAAGRGLVSLPAFFRDWRSFRKRGGQAPFAEIAPKLFDGTSSTQTGGGHYFFQDIWALNHLNSLRPARHYDIGSRIDGFAGQATAICPIVYVDIRPPNLTLPGFEFRQGSILELPFADGSIGSLSCLHVVEHIGLGRYGDAIDPKGSEKALKELQRVVAPGGQLLFSMPIGHERVEFNAQRVWNPDKPIRLLDSMRLVEFKAVDDSGRFRNAVQPLDFYDSKYACGLYCFVKN